MKLLSVFEVIANTDTTEGRGTNYVAGRFISHGDAIEFGKDKGVWGAPADIRPGMVLEMDDGTFRAVVEGAVRVNTSLRDMEIQSARAKLTPRELELLGLVEKPKPPSVLDPWKGYNYNK